MTSCPLLYSEYNLEMDKTSRTHSKSKGGELNYYCCMFDRNPFFYREENCTSRSIDRKVDLKSYKKNKEKLSIEAKSSANKKRTNRHTMNRKKTDRKIGETILKFI